MQYFWDYISKSGVTKAQVADAIDIAASSVGRRKTFEPAEINKIARLLGRSFDEVWAHYGETASEQSFDEVDPDSEIHCEGEAQLGQFSWRKDGSKRIPITQIEAAMGAGMVPYDRSITHWVEFSDDLVRLRGDEIGITVRGESMEPTYRSGDVVIIRPQEHFDGDGIYVIADSDGLFMLKRLQKVPSPDGDVIKVLSDNAAYSSFDFPARPVDGWRIVARGTLRWFELA